MTAAGSTPRLAVIAQAVHTCNILVIVVASMFRNPRHSLSRAFSIMLALLLATALAAMISAISILLASQNDARAINVSGSLRMQSYRLAHAVATHAPEATLASYNVQFSQSLADPSLQPYLGPPTRPLNALAATIYRNWALTQDRLDTPASRPQLHAAVAAMVADIDQLVANIQQDLEHKVRDLLLVQGLCLALLLALASWALLQVRQRLLRPLRQLEQAAQQVEQGHFQLSLSPVADDELGALSRAFARMAAELARLYGGLEAEVSSKTTALQQANTRLALLYRCAEQMHTRYLDEATIQALLEDVRASCQLQRLSLLLEDERSGLPCRIEASSSNNRQTLSVRSWPLAPDGDAAGELRAIGYQAAAEESDELLASIARLLERRLQIEILLRSDQQRLVQEERAIIARELHDSLAQTLSTIRFQLTVARHQLQQQPELVAEQLEQIQAITADAYRHLRELLVTFRLTVCATSLESAIRTLIDELAGQLQPAISLDYQPQQLCLAAPRYIHILQIVREAVLNAAKHAGSNQIAISVSGGGSQALQIQIRDNGRGIDPAIVAARHGHFGLDIMRERARSLGGELQIDTAAGGGTCVTLSLPATKENA